jgi:hypothetical protein
MKKFVPFPAGTVRGPFPCGLGADPAGGVQFLVKCRDGCWAPFIGKRGGEESAARRQAEERAKLER